MAPEVHLQRRRDPSVEQASLEVKVASSGGQHCRKEETELMILTCFHDLMTCSQSALFVRPKLFVQFFGYGRKGVESGEARWLHEELHAPTRADSYTLRRCPGRFLGSSSIALPLRESQSVCDLKET